jgi:hypothetical protein
MSEDYSSNQRTKGQRGTKNVKVYEVKQADNKDLRNSEREEISRPKRVEEGSVRQNTKYSEDNYWKENGYSKNSTSSKNNYPSRKRRQNYIQFSKKDVLDKHVGSSQPKQGFLELMNENPQIFVREKLTPLNVGFKKFDFKNDECINSKQRLNDATSEDNDRRVLQKFSESKKAADLWDIGSGKEIFDEIDMKRVDAELRGLKTKTDRQKEAELKDQEKAVIEEQTKQTDPNTFKEDEGEFSKIDVIFEQKLKSLNQEAEDDDEMLVKGSTEHTQEDEEADTSPIWKAFGAEEIHKNIGSMESLFVESNEKNAINNFGIRLEGNFDPFLDSSKCKEQTGTTFGKTSNKIFPLYSVEDSYDDSSTDVSQNLTPVNELNWSTNKNAELATPSFVRKHQQQQIEPSSQPKQSVVRQARPMPLNLNSRLSSNISAKANPVQTVGGDKAVQYVPLQHFPGFSKLTTSSNPNKIGLSKQIPPSKDCLFKFFTGGSDYERKYWYYKDLKNIVRGPFSAKEMDEWYNANYLPSDLMITYGENINFRALSELKKYKDSFVSEISQPKSVQSTSVKQGVNLNNLSSNELQELAKNPEFIEYARASSLNLNQLMYLIKQREANQKSNGLKKSGGYNADSFESQGYYPSNNSDVSRGSFGANSTVNTSNGFQSGISTVPDYNYKQGIYNNYNNIDYNQTNKRTSTQGYPGELQQQYNGGYPSTHSAASQSSTHRTQPSFNFSGQVESPSFMTTDDYKSFITTKTGNGGINRLV